MPKISELPVATTISGVEKLTLVQNGVSKSISASNFSNQLNDTQQLDNVVVVNSVDDLPAPIAGVITLVAGTEYRVAPYATINLGTNRIETIGESTIWGSVGTPTLIYSGTGTMFTTTAAAVGASLRLANLLILATAGTFLDVDAKLDILVLNTVTILALNLGDNWYATHVNGFRCQFLNFDTGMTATGSDQKTFLFTQCGFTPNATSTFCIDLNGSIIQSSIAFRQCLFTLGNAANVAIKGSAGSANIGATGSGLFEGCRLVGLGQAYDTITPYAARWAMNSNIRMLNTSVETQLYIAAGDEALSDTASAGLGVYIPVAGTHTVDEQHKMTTDADGKFYNNSLESRPFRVVWNGRIEPQNGNNRQYRLACRHGDGTVILHSITNVQADNSDPKIGIVLADVHLDPGDYAEIVISQPSGTLDSPEISGLTLLVTAIL